VYNLYNILDSLRWFSQRHSRTQVLCARCVRCSVSLDRIALFTFCVMTQQSSTFWALCTPTGGYDPKIRTGPRFLCNAPTPSFIILCFFVWKLSCWPTNTPTNLQTNRRYRKHPTFVATQRHRVINIIDESKPSGWTSLSLTMTDSCSRLPISNMASLRSVSHWTRSSLQRLMLSSISDDKRRSWGIVSVCNHIDRPISQLFLTQCHR